MSDDLVRAAPARRDGPLRCALCHGGVDEAEAARCAGCATLLHPDCRSQLGSCPTLGCEASSARSVVVTGAKADCTVERLPWLPLRAWASTTLLLPGWFGLARAVEGGASVWGLAAIAGLIFCVPPTLLVQLVLQLALRVISARGRPVSVRFTRRATLAPLALLLLGMTVHEVYEARYRFAPKVVGRVVANDGARGEILRREEPRFELGDDPYLVTWVLRVTDSQGRVREGVIDREEASRLDGPRSTRYELAWRPAGDALEVVRRSGDGHPHARGVAYVFPAGVRAVWQQRDDVVRLDDRAAPLDDDVRERLSRLPLPAEAWQGLSMVRTDDIDDGGGGATQWLCERPDVLVVVGPDRRGSGQVVTRGPILVMGDPSYGDLASGAWVFFDDETSPRGFLYPVLAERIFVTRAAFSGDDDVVRAPEVVPAR